MKVWSPLGLLLAAGLVVPALSHGGSTKPRAPSAEDGSNYRQFANEVKDLFPNASVAEENPNLQGTTPPPAACMKKLETQQSSKLRHKKRGSDGGDQGCGLPSPKWYYYKMYTDKNKRLGRDVTARDSDIPPRAVDTITENLKNKVRTASLLPSIRTQYIANFVIISTALKAEFQLEMQVPFKSYPESKQPMSDAVRYLYDDGADGEYFGMLIEWAVKEIVYGKANAARWYAGDKDSNGRTKPLGRITITGFTERDIKHEISKKMPFERELNANLAPASEQDINS
ncbi:MAG: hypothetical protein Q9165_001059 [Trypethelium subeluteriae]